MKRRLNNSSNAVELETTSQLRGNTDMIVVAGLTVGNISPGNFDGLDRTVLYLVLFVFVVLAFRFTSPINSPTSSSLLIILGRHSGNF